MKKLLAFLLFVPLFLGCSDEEGDVNPEGSMTELDIKLNGSSFEVDSVFTIIQDVTGTRALSISAYRLGSSTGFTIQITNFNNNGQYPLKGIEQTQQGQVANLDFSQIVFTIPGDDTTYEGFSSLICDPGSGTVTVSGYNQENRTLTVSFSAKLCNINQSGESMQVSGELRDLSW